MGKEQGVRASRDTPRYAMRNKHRKTLVREEGWPLIDGWYWCPLPLIEKRVEEKAREYKEWLGRIGVGYEFTRWENSQYNLEQRLAHKCESGRIRAPQWVQCYQRDSGGLSIYGRCKGCSADISDGIKTIIILEEM